MNCVAAALDRDSRERRERATPGPSQRRGAAHHCKEHPSRHQAQAGNLDQTQPMKWPSQQAIERRRHRSSTGRRARVPTAPPASSGSTRCSVERSAPGMLSTKALAAESSAVAIVATAIPRNVGFEITVQNICARTNDDRPRRAVSGTIAAVHRISRTRRAAAVGRTGPAARASSTMSSSVLTCVTSQQTLQRLIPAMRGHLDGRLGHAQAPGDFAHRLVLEFQGFDHLTLPLRQ